MTEPSSVPETATVPAEDAAPALRRVLLDTSVLAPEPLWLWTLALAEAVPTAQRPVLLVTDGVAHELRAALRRVDPRLDRARADAAARLRLDSLTRDAVSAHSRGQPSDDAPSSDQAAGSQNVGTTPAAPRAHVIDPDDAHLDADALRLGADTLLTDDVHAFAPLPDVERGYHLLIADAFLCTLADRHALDLVAVHDRYAELVEHTADALGLDPVPGSASHRLRRSRARRFATRVVRALRRA